MNSWSVHKIRDIAIGVYDGPHATPPISERGPVFLGIGNVTEDGHLDLTQVRHIAEGDFGKWTKRVIPSQGDIVFTYEATLNRYAIIPAGFRGCLGRRMALIRPNVAKVDTQFLFYSFFGKAWRDTIEANRLSGATVDRIPLTKFPDFPIALPPLETQQRIASILGAYDDLIEVNRRRVVILETMARAMFEEWFVRFRFPGHESVAMMETAEGLLPEGWQPMAVENLLQRVPVKKRYSQKTALPEGKVPILDQGKSGVIGYHNDAPSVLAGVDNPVVVFANHTCYQKVVHFSFSAIQNVLPFLPSKAAPQCIYWLHHATSGLVHLNDYKGHWPELMSKLIPMPSHSLAERFDRFAKPLHLSIYWLQDQNERLAASRDLLLPRLISGQLSVEAAEREMEEAA